MAGSATLDILLRANGVSKTKADLADIGGAGAKMGDALAAAGKVAAVGIAAIGAGFAASLVAASDFESRMSGVKAVSGATGEEMAALSKLALQLGKDTVFSASEAAKGIEELVKGGISIADIMGGAALASLNLASAGEIDLASAAEIAANAMNQFGLTGKDMAHVSDLIAGAANASSLSVMDFKLSLSQVGAVANVAGQSFDSTAQAIAVMGAAGIKGSDAGTSLKQMFLNLQPTTDKAITTFRELGIITKSGANAFFDAAGSAKSMRDIAEVLNVSMAGLTDQQRLAKLEIMFGSDAMRASAIMAKAGGEGFDKMAESMGKVTAAGVAAERLNNVRGSLEQLKGSLETAAITLGMVFLPLIKQAVDRFTEFVNAAMPLIEEVGPRLIVGLEAVGNLLRGDTAPAFEIVTNAAEMARTMLINAFGNVFDWLRDNLPGIVAQLAAWGQEFIAWVAPMIGPMMGELGRFLSTVLDWLIENAPGIAHTMLAEWVPAMVGWIEEAAIKIVENLPGILWAIGSWIMNEGVPKLWELNLRLGEAVIDGIIDGIKGVAGKLFDALGGMLKGLFQFGQNAIDAHSPSRLFAEIGESIGEGLAEGITESTSLAVQAISALSGAVITQSNQLLQELTAQGQAQFQASVLAWKSQLAGLRADSDAARLEMNASDSIFRNKLTMAEEFKARATAQQATDLGMTRALQDAGVSFGNATGWQLENLYRQFFPEADFAHGGTVPGPLGAPMLATVHGGERVTPPGQGGVTVIVQGPIYGFDDFERRVAEAWNNAFRRGGFSQVRA